MIIFVRFQLTSPYQSRKKLKKNLFYFRLMASIKNIKHNLQENIVQCWFYETGINILRLISKAPPPLLLIFRQNSNVDYVTPIL